MRALSAADRSDGAVWERGSHGKRATTTPDPPLPLKMKPDREAGVSDGRASKPSPARVHAPAFATVKTASPFAFSKTGDSSESVSSPPLPCSRKQPPTHRPSGSHSAPTGGPPGLLHVPKRVSHHPPERRDVIAPEEGRSEAESRGEAGRRTEESGEDDGRL